PWSSADRALLARPPQRASDLNGSASTKDGRVMVLMTCSWVSSAGLAPIKVRANSGRAIFRIEMALLFDHRNWDGLEPGDKAIKRSEEHTSELQSRENLGCRLL